MKKKFLWILVLSFGVTIFSLLLTHSSLFAKETDNLLGVDNEVVYDSNTYPKDDYYLFDVTKRRLKYQSTDFKYEILFADQDSYLLITNKASAVTKKIKLGIYSEFNIFSVSPDDKFVALFDHMQNYGGSILHIVSTEQNKLITSIPNSIGDIHWFEGNMYFSQLNTICTDNCDDKQYQTVFNKLDLKTYAQSVVLPLTEVEDESQTIKLVEKHFDHFIIGIVDPFKLIPRQYKVIDIKNATVNNFTVEQLKAFQLFGLKEYYNYRVEKLNEYFIVTDTRPDQRSLNPDEFIYGDDYPYPGGSGIDPWDFYIGQCTSYAAHKASQQLSDFKNKMYGPNGKQGHFGDGGNWNDNAIAIGFTVQNTPAVGAIVVMEPNVEKIGTGWAGHVAYVEAVNSNGTFDLSEYNWASADESYNERYNRTNYSQYYDFILFSQCAYNPGQTWSINTECIIDNNRQVSDNIVITSTGKLIVQNNAFLDFDFVNKNILINNGGKLEIKNGSKIY